MQEKLHLVLQISVGVIPLLIFLGILIYYINRRNKSKKKILTMESKKKIQTLNELLKPFGFYYDRVEDLISSLHTAWQRNTGYNTLYDKAALKFNMVLDELPVYFEYEKRTWLIEFWKGQYGITTGCEVGIYYADEVVAPTMRKFTHYEVIKDEEMPYIQFRLSKKNMEFSYNNTHWWLTAFRVGEFSEPEELDYRVKLVFRTKEQAWAFYKGIREGEYPKEKVEIKNQTVYIWLPKGERGRMPFWERRQRRFVQRLNKRLVFLYRQITTPFEENLDRILFLYYQLPALFKIFFRMMTMLPKG